MNLAVCLVYCSPRAPTTSLSCLLEVAVSRALLFLILLVLGDFSVHSDAAPSQQATYIVSSMVIVSGPTHPADLMMDLVFGMGIDMDPMIRTEVP